MNEENEYIKDKECRHYEEFKDANLKHFDIYRSDVIYVKDNKPEDEEHILGIIYRATKEELEKLISGEINFLVLDDVANGQDVLIGYAETIDDTIQNLKKLREVK